MRHAVVPGRAFSRLTQDARTPSGPWAVVVGAGVDGADAADRCPAAAGEGCPPVHAVTTAI
ncbi:MAG: hypothetical protein ACRDRL_29200, partial [Sciscionella sp.]